MIDPLANSAWFDGSLRQPWEDGVYQRRIGRATMYARWDGRTWYAARNTAGKAMLVMIVSYTQTAMWRGLANPPHQRAKAEAIRRLPLGFSREFPRVDDGDGY